MSKRTSLVQHVTNFFTTADEGAVNVMLEVVRQIIASRFKKEVKRRGPNKPRGSQAPSLLTNQGDAQGSDAADA